MISDSVLFSGISDYANQTRTRISRSNFNFNFNLPLRSPLTGPKKVTFPRQKIKQIAFFSDLSNSENKTNGSEKKVRCKKCHAQKQVFFRDFTGST
jgi:hypothetical protein